MIDPVPYLESRNIEPHLPGEKNVTRGWVNVRCPFPDCDDPSWHCGINLESGMFNCYVCGRKGHVTRLIARIDDCSRDRARAVFAAMEGSDPSEDRRTEPDPYEGKAKKCVLPTEATEDFPKIHLSYLKDRGFDPEFLISRYGLRACANVGRYKFRIVVPYLLDGRLVTFSSRDVTGRSPIRYKDCPPELSVIPTKETVYNIDRVKDRVLIVEGPFDVMRIGDGAVGTSTDNYGPRQVAMLNGLVRRGVRYGFVMFDAGKSARERAERLAGELAFEHVEALGLSSPSDPGEMDEGEVGHLRRELGL